MLKEADLDLDKKLSLKEFKSYAYINRDIIDFLNGFQPLIKTGKEIEGSINEDGVVLGLSGLIVNVDKSYNNMKGIGFKEEFDNLNYTSQIKSSRKKRK